MFSNLPGPGRPRGPDPDVSERLLARDVFILNPENARCTIGMAAVISSSQQTKQKQKKKKKKEGPGLSLFIQWLCAGAGDKGDGVSDRSTHEQ